MPLGTNTDVKLVPQIEAQKTGFPVYALEQKFMNRLLASGCLSMVCKADWIKPGVEVVADERGEK